MIRLRGVIIKNIPEGNFPDKLHRSKKKLYNEIMQLYKQLLNRRSSAGGILENLTNCLHLNIKDQLLQELTLMGLPQLKIFKSNLITFEPMQIEY